MMSSTLRTKNKECIEETFRFNTASGQDVEIERAAPFFVECIRAAMRAALDAAIEAGIDVILLARVSGGIYAGAWRTKMTQRFYRKLVVDLLAEEVVIVLEENVFDTASGQDAAPGPDRPPHPTTDHPSQDEPEIEPGSAQAGSASGHDDFELARPMDDDQLLLRSAPRNTRRRLAEGDADPVAADNSLRQWLQPGVVMPHSMPRGAFFQRVVMPWILE